MKPSAFLFLLFTASLNAQETLKAGATPSNQPVLPPPILAEPAPKFRSTPQVQLDLLMVAVPEAQAVALRPRLSDAASITQAQAELLEMVSRKQSRLIDWLTLTLHDGERSVCEAIVEERYPIEFGLSEPPEGEKGKASSAPAAPPSESARTAPSTFETRNTGSTLEAEVHVSPDAKAVTVQVVPQWIGMDKKLFPISSAKDAPSISQPIVTNGKVSTTVTLQHGESRLIYFGKTPAASEVVIFILTARIHAPKPH